jgi:uncharacterized protein YabE (DUF348 family)
MSGASALSSSFTGPAQYSPSYPATDTPEIPEAAYQEPYAPYADGAGDYADPYADHYREPHPGDLYDYPPEAGSAPYGPPYPDFGHPEAHYEPYPDDTGTAAPPPGEPTSRLPRQRTQPEQPRTRAGARTRGRPRTPIGARAVQGLVLASLIGGTTAFVAFEKTVNVSVDGTVRQVRSFASTVGAVLSADNVNTGGHDIVSPAPGAALVDNSTITVRYGRPLALTVNGSPSRVWVHSPTVGAALQELGIRAQGARLSTSTDAPVNRSGLALTVFTMRHLTLLVDGKSDQLDTTAGTVGDALTQAGVTLRDQDAPSVPITAVPTDGETISILRVTGTTEVKQIAIAYAVTKIDDASTFIGSTSVVTAGVTGVAQVTYAKLTINGVKQPPKEISRTVTRQPVNEVEKVGTKSLPTDVTKLNWAALANCESGGNPKSVDSSGNYYGLYQFSPSTWASLGGTGLPSNASAAEQTTRAELLYQRSGSGQWPACGHNLFT